MNCGGCVEVIYKINVKHNVQNRVINESAIREVVVFRGSTHFQTRITAARSDFTSLPDWARP